MPNTQPMPSSIPSVAVPDLATPPGREGMQRYLDWEQKLTAHAPH